MKKYNPKQAPTNHEKWQNFTFKATRDIVLPRDLPLEIRVKDAGKLLLLARY